MNIGTAHFISYLRMRKFGDAHFGHNEPRCSPAMFPRPRMGGTRAPRSEEHVVRLARAAVGLLRTVPPAHTVCRQDAGRSRADLSSEARVRCCRDARSSRRAPRGGRARAARV